ncbi:MAG: hypothetical protein HYR66_01305 [Sphingobacteriales bacterium]|nr:hypothetical protein [Sphingobacteriales bacterium]MBI3718761.1 hypothetical protein [Sphingobacteriales bacterium]
MKRISNVFGTTLLVKVFPTVFVGATLVFVGVAIYNVHFLAALILSLPLIVFLFSSPGRYLKLKEVFLDYETQTIAVSMGRANWKEYKFEQLEEVIFGKMDTILELYFVNGERVSFLAGRLWGKAAEIEKIKTELNDIIKKYSKK